MTTSGIAPARTDEAVLDRAAMNEPPARQRPQDSGGALEALTAALEYIEEQHWEVVLGASVRRSPAGWSCSCDNPRCAAPGAHPADSDWPAQIIGQASQARASWSADPEAAVLLPAGRAFDVLEVPESAGFLALARLERSDTAVGPVSMTPDRRMYFFVLPNARTPMLKLLAALGWSYNALDLTCRSTGSTVLAPPSRMGGLGRAQWVRSPLAANGSLPDVEEVLAPLAYACKLHR